MNPMTLRQNESLRERLASEYALGTLRGGARRRFESWIRDDASLRRAVAEWQDRLNPLAELSPSVQPPPRVWLALEKRLDLRTGTRRGFWMGLRENLSFWRGLGMASTALATILLAVLVMRQPEVATPTTSYIATLSDDKSNLAVVVTGNAEQRQLTVKVVSGLDVGPDRSLELWGIPPDGAPRSLGLVAGDGTVTLTLPEGATPETLPTLAISLEPKGGSPSAAGPTGPVLYTGPWLRT